MKALRNFLEKSINIWEISKNPTLKTIYIEIASITSKSTPLQYASFYQIHFSKRGIFTKHRNRPTNISKQKKEIQNLFYLYHQCLILNGAKGGTRTHTPKALDPKSSASANSATLANGEPYWNRTSDTMIKSHVLYLLS